MRRLLLLPAPPRLFAADTFSRPDSNTALGSADLGGAWTATSTAAAACVFGIMSGQGYCVSSAGADALAYLDTGRADNFRLSLDLGMPASAQMGAVIRFVDGSNYLGARLVQVGNAVQIVRNLAGTRSVIFSGSRTLTAGVPVHIDVDVAGSQITVLVNGQPYVSGADPNFLTSTKHGLWAASAALGVNSWFDNLQVRERVA